MSMFPIASATVGAGGASNITFSSIPQNFTHLQLRIFGFTNRATYGLDVLLLRFNSDTGNNYATHALEGGGSIPSSNGDESQSRILTSNIGTTVSNFPGLIICDILDYTNTNKYKTTRMIGGVDVNGTIASVGGYVGINSGLWQNTNAINTIFLAPFSGTAFAQNSRFDLYGIQTSNATGA